MKQTKRQFTRTLNTDVSSASDHPVSRGDSTAGEMGDDLLDRVTLELVEFVQWHERSGIRQFTPRQILEAFWTHKTIRGDK